MRSNKAISFVLLALCVILSCVRKGTAFEIEDLNGTWQPDWSYKASAKLPDGEKHYSKWEYSWGTAITIPNTTFEIDLGAAKPYISEPGLGMFPILEVRKTGRDAVMIKALRGDINNPNARWLPTAVFHFIDKDRIWIETDDFTGEAYGKDAVWHRLSGPQ